jgi:hypothetical protein
VVGEEPPPQRRDPQGLGAHPLAKLEAHRMGPIHPQVRDSYPFGFFSLFFLTFWLFFSPGVYCPPVFLSLALSSALPFPPSLPPSLAPSTHKFTNPRILFLTLCAILNTYFYFFENAYFGDQVKWAKVNAEPVFIIGQDNRDTVSFSLLFLFTHP